MFDDTTNPAKPTIVHDPDAVLDYTWDFSSLIVAGDAVDTVSFHPTTNGVVVTPGAIVGNTAVGWVSVTDATLEGLTVGVACRYVTTGGRTDDRTLWFKIKER
jgi:hypothetical protein